MEKKRPPLSLDELYQLKWLLGGTLVLLAVGSVFYLEFDAWTLMGVTSVAVLAVLAWPGLPARVPAWAHRLAFPAVVAFFIGDLWLTGEILPATVRLDILLLLYRGTSYRRKRDDLQVIVLGLFLVVVAGVLTVSLVFAVQILVFTAVALAYLLVITLVESAETGLPAARGPTGPGWVHVGWRRLGRRVRETSDARVLALGGGLFIGVVGLSALLFLAIPRFQLENSLFLERFVSKKARTGFNDTIRFGDVTEIQQDTGVALSVDVTDRAQIPAAPYWRMLVLDEYRDGTFRLSALLRRTAFTPEYTASGTRGTARAHGGEPVYWTFYLESGVSRYLPLLGTFEQLRFGGTQNFRVAAKLGVLALRDEPVTMTAYRVEGMNAADTLADASFGLRLRDPQKPGPMTNAMQMLQLGVGEADRATLDRLVRDFTGGAELPAAELARRGSAWLAQHHAYLLTPQVPAGPGDPLVRWLASDAKGNCELFASSFVLLARAAGLPARVVTGFRGGTWNAYSNNFTIRNSDAHAWCEVFDRSIGAWRRVDPTPGAPSGPGEQTKGEATLVRRLDRSWSARFDSLRVFWYRRVVNFDQRAQVETLKAVKEATENSGKQLRAALTQLVDSMKAWLTAPWDARRLAKLLGGLAAGVGLAWGWRTFGLGWWRRFRSATAAHPGDPVRARAGGWLRALAELPGTGPETADVRVELQRLRFGARATWPDPEPVFRRARQALRAARRRRRVRSGSV